MKQFETGKTYKVNGAGCIQITKRTDKYISFVGDYKGRKLINQDDLFGLGEHIVINTKKDCQYEGGKINIKVFCFAGREM